MQRHISVMLTETIESINTMAGGVYLDATFGAGGHSEALLEADAAQVIGLDRDNQALERYRKAGRFRDDPRLSLVHTNYSQIDSLVENNSLDGIIADLGVSTQQLFDPQRGFSFSHPGPIDMRMDHTQSETLHSLLAQTNETDLSDFFRNRLGLPKAHSLARRIFQKFENNELNTTEDLVAVAGKRTGPKHPATKLFLALRIYINGEFREIEEGLPLLVRKLKVGGRLAVISFHSSEDRIVKNLFKKLAGRCTCNLHPCCCNHSKQVGWVFSKPKLPTAEELRMNPRARSAKLRCVEKIIAAL